MRRRTKTSAALGILLAASCIPLGLAVLAPPPLDPDLLVLAPPRTSLLAVGDILLARQIGIAMAEAGDFTLPFRSLAATLRSADLAFGNLEGPFCSKPPFTRRGIIFRVNPRAVDGLRFAGFDVVSLANNHSYDGGSNCLEFTVSRLGAHGILAAGAGKTAEEAHTATVVERNRVRFAFLGYTYAARNEGLRLPRSRWVPEVAHLDIRQMQRDVAAARQVADVVIVSMHTGVEYSPRPSASTRRFARAAVAAGASVVLGHHPHVAQPVEHYFDPAGDREGWIFYSLGNFVFWQTRAETRRALMARVIFRGARVEEVEAVPLVIEAFAAPRLARWRERTIILASVGLRRALVWPSPVRR